jgi:DNA-binding transcriptional LysR family regulator
MFDFTDLKLIQFVSEELTLSAVAVRARMSLPAVSQRLSKLEDSLKAKLVHRTGGFGLTAAGKLFLDSANLITAEVDKLARDLRAEKSGHETMLRIMTAQSILIDDLPAALDAMAMENPALRFTVTEGTTADIARLISEGEIDIGLLTNPGAMQAVELIHYKTERACLIVPLNHPLAQQPGPLYFREAVPFPFIGIEDSPTTVSYFDSSSRIDIRSVSYRIRVSSLEAQAILVGQTNLGIAVTLESVARRHARTQPIHVIRLADPWALSESYICVRNSLELSIVGQHLIALITSQFSNP